MQEQFLHLTPDKWQALIPPSDEFSAEIFMMKNLQYIMSQKNAVYHTQQTFYKEQWQKIPFIIGVTGSVAVGKSTFAKKITRLFERLEPDKKIENGQLTVPRTNEGLGVEIDMDAIKK